MQQDFHFNVIYALCRCSGFSPNRSQTIAAASQYTDDCTLVSQMQKPDGSRYVPIQTQCPGQMAFAERWERGILFPFHFLCEDENYPFTVPGNARALRLLRNAAALLAGTEPFTYHALGIALHSFADTFAHQGFSAFDDPRNDVSDLELVPKDDDLLERITGRFLHDLPKLPPRIGHAQAVYCPDIPFLKFRYRAVEDTRWIGEARRGAVSIVNGFIERDNAPIAASAAEQIIGVLANAPGAGPAVSPDQQVAFFNADRFREMDSLNEREGQWQDLFLDAPFFAACRTAADTDCCRYDGKDWLGKAYGFVLPSGGGPGALALKPGYDTTDWWKFQLAGQWVKAHV